MLNATFFVDRFVFPIKKWQAVMYSCSFYQMHDVDTSWPVMTCVSGRPGLDDAGEHGRPISRCSICFANQQPAEPHLHWPSHKNQIWLSYHHGGRKKIMLVIKLKFIAVWRMCLFFIGNKSLAGYLCFTSPLRITQQIAFSTLPIDYIT